jgi:hypothetical protein
MTPQVQQQKSRSNNFTEYIHREVKHYYGINSNTVRNTKRKKNLESTQMSTKSIVLYIQLLSHSALSHDAVLERCHKHGTGLVSAEIFSDYIKVNCSENNVQLIPLSLTNENTPCEEFLDVCNTTSSAIAESGSFQSMIPDEIIDVKARVNIPIAASASKRGDNISILCKSKESKRMMEFSLTGTVVDRVDPIAIQKLCEDFFAGEAAGNQIVPAAEIVPILAEEPTTSTTTTDAPTTTTTAPETTPSVTVPKYTRPSVPRGPPRRNIPSRRTTQVRYEPRVPTQRRPVRKVRVVVDLNGNQQFGLRPHYHQAYGHTHHNH